MTTETFKLALTNASVTMTKQQWQQLNSKLIADGIPLAIHSKQTYEAQEQETIKHIAAPKHKLHDDFGE